MRTKFTALLLSLALFANVASAATFSLFSPATGLLKGNSGTYITSAGTASDVLALWTGTCNSTTFLRADGTCVATAAGTVTSVGLTVPSGFSVTGSPVTSSGTLAVTGTLNPSAGGTGVGTLTGLITGNGTSPFSAATSSNVISLWTGTCSSGTYLRGDGACAAAGSSAAGSTSNVQYNASGAFAASTAFSYTESLDAGGSYFPSILQLGATAGGSEGALFGTGALTLSAFASKMTSGANYYDYFNSGYIQMYPANSNGGAMIIQSGSAPSAGAGGTLLIQAGDAAGGNNNGGEVDIRSGNKTGSGTIGVIKIQPNSVDQMVIGSTGVTVGGATGGFQGTGTINAAGLYVNGVAVGGGVSGANPTATIGASAVNGVATTYMRSDAAPALPATLPALSGVNLTALNGSSISSGTVPVANGGTGVTSSTGTGSVVLSASPTLTGTVTAATVAATAVTASTLSATASVRPQALQVVAATPIFKMSASGAAVDNKSWEILTGGTNWILQTLNDAENSTTAAVTVNRSGNTVSAINLTATAVQANGSNVCTANGTNCPSAAKTAFGKVNGSGVCGISNTSGLTTPCTRNSAGNYSITHSPALSTNTSCVVTVDTGSSTAPIAFSSSNGTTLNVITQTTAGVATDTGFSVICMSL